MGSVPGPKIDAWWRELHAFCSLIVSFLPDNVEENSEGKTLSRFQVDLKQNRLRSTKPVVEVSKIDSTRLRSLKSTPVDFIRLSPRLPVWTRLKSTCAFDPSGVDFADLSHSQVTGLSETVDRLDSLVANVHRRCWWSNQGFAQCTLVFLLQAKM